ncbi:hypothetical protein E3N88_25043 [Mikania micrantha]|uniref:Uncharacterized protein n=1 Tax=Mikania micrantha TaxID=192012 RepID=A0A5N6N3M1_9ASTR|nr:hypothetical protein E3N88_25043 [Mikania micrantha]
MKLAVEPSRKSEVRKEDLENLEEIKRNWRFTEKISLISKVTMKQIDVLNEEELDVPEYVKEKGHKFRMDLKQWQLQWKLDDEQLQQDLKQHQEWLERHFRQRKELLREARLKRQQHQEQQRKQIEVQKNEKLYGHEYLKQMKEESQQRLLQQKLYEKQFLQDIRQHREQFKRYFQQRQEKSLERRLQRQHQEQLKQQPMKEVEKMEEVDAHEHVKPVNEETHKLGEMRQHQEQYSKYQQMHIHNLGTSFQKVMDIIRWKKQESWSKNGSNKIKRD